MVLDPLIPIAVIGGVAYELTQKAAPSAPVKPVLPPTNMMNGSGASSPGTTVKQNIGNRMRMLGTANNMVPAGGVGILNVSSALSPVKTAIATTQPSQSVAVDPNLQAVLNQAQQQAKSAFDSMSDAAKQQGCQYLNEQLHISPPLKGNESWDQLSKVIGSAAGSAVGTSVGNGLCGPPCGIAGSYLGAFCGQKIEDFLQNNLPSWQDIKDEYNKVSGDVTDAVTGEASDVYNDVSSSASDAYDSASDSVSDAFNSVF